MQSLAAELGWVVDDKGALTNPVDGLSQPGVSTSITRGDAFGTITWRVTDVVREESAEGAAFLDDQYALLVRQGSGRWGRPKLSHGGSETAQWDTPGGGRVVARRGKYTVSLEFATPQQVVEYVRRGE